MMGGFVRTNKEGGMRTSLALVVLGCAALAGGCGDDSSSSGNDMSMAADLSMPSGGGPTCADYCAKIAMN